MDQDAVLVLVVMTVVAVADAVRDAWVTRKWGIGWWQWHVAKWVAFYCPFLVLGFFYFKGCEWSACSIIVFVIWCMVCWALWRLVYRLLR